MNVVKVAYLSGLATLLCGCGGSGTSTSQNSIPYTETIEARSGGNWVQPDAAAPNYVEAENGVYFYVTAVSREDEEKGRAVGNVLGYRYRGFQDGRHILVSVDDNGRLGHESTCSDPCRIIVTRLSGGRVDRIPFSSSSVIGSAFADAINGHLEVTSASAGRNADSSARELLGPEGRVPVVFIGEWNSDVADCGTGNNASRLRIEAHAIRFYESTGQVTRVTAHDAQTATVDAQFSGEGETWTNRHRLQLSPSGNELTISDFTRYRCPR